MSKITKISGRTVFESPWMHLREDLVRFPDGSEGQYGIVDKPDYALVVPIHEDGTCQMVKPYRYSVGAAYWEFPQGNWEDNPDADPRELANGELEEETGFRASHLEEIGHLFPAYGFLNQGFNIFIARGLTQGTMNRDAGETGMATAAFSMREIKAMIGTGEVKDASTLAALGLMSLFGKLP